MSESNNLPPLAPDDVAKARQLDQLARALLATPVARAFESGRAFNEIADGQLYRALGFATLEDYHTSLEAAGFKRATIYSNMRLVQKFDRELHGHVGVGRLRLLSADYVVDPHQLIAEGIDVPDGKGGFTRRPVKELSCAKLGRELRKLRPPQPRPRKRKEVEQQPDPLVALAEAAVAPLLAGAGDAEGREAGGGAVNELIQPMLPLPPTASPPATADLDGLFIDDEEAYASATPMQTSARTVPEKRGGMPRARSA